MDEVQFDDLKQFITATSSQLEGRLTERIDGLEGKVDGLEQRFDGLEQKVDRLEQKMDDGFAGIGEAMEAAQTETDRRLTSLEEQAEA